MARHRADGPAEETPPAGLRIAAALPASPQEEPAPSTASLRTIRLPPARPVATASRAAAAPPAPNAPRPPARTAPASASPFPPVATPAPVPARGTPAAETAPLALPALAAPTLDTGPVAVVRGGRGDRRGTRSGRIALAVAAVATAGIVVVQVGVQRSEAAGRPAPAPAAPAASARAPEVDPITVDATSPSAPSTTAAAPSRTARSSSATSTRPGTAEAVAPATRKAIRSSTPAHRAEPTPERDGSTSSAPGSSRPADGRPGTDGPSGDGELAVRALEGGHRGELELAAGRWRLDDFGSDLLGVAVDGRLVGAGSGSTVLEMAADSSSRRSRVPHTLWQTNQLSLVKVDHAKVVQGFTLRGTDQGHLYNGLRISHGTGTRVSDVRVEAIPGDDDRPPGETFGINDFHTDGARYSHVEVDGAGVSAATFGTNSSEDVTVDDSSFHDSRHANGATFWQTKDVTVRNTASVRNHDAAFNFERVSGTVVLDHVTMRDNDLAHLRINSDRASAEYRIIDPVFDGDKLTIVMTPKYMGSRNVQKRSDVHVIVDGVDRTDELVRWKDHF